MLSHLARLEAEAIYIFREVVSEFERPVLMYSVGKDSSVLLHLARKAFFPGPLPFPLLHIDTGWKFQQMYAFRDAVARELDLDLHVHRYQGETLDPFSVDSSVYTDRMKTSALRQALAQGRYDAAFGGARRDEERARAKERIYSFRDQQQRWDPRQQRPELWQLYNSRVQQGESMRIFPLSNWTERDIWQYILAENIALPELYFAAERPVVERNGQLLVVDDDRFPLHADEQPQLRSVRFRTLGCYPLTAAIESTATTLEQIVEEVLNTDLSERSGRLIDSDQSASMERKKREGYF